MKDLHSNFWLDYIRKTKLVKKKVVTIFTFQFLVRLYTEYTKSNRSNKYKFTFQFLVRLYTDKLFDKDNLKLVFTFQFLVRLYTYISG